MWHWWSKPQSAAGLFFADCIEFSIFSCKEYNESDLSIDSLVISIYKAVSYVIGKKFAVTGVFLWQSSASLCRASFCSPRPNLPVIPDIFWLPTCSFQSPMMKMTSFFVVSSRRYCRSSCDVCVLVPQSCLTMSDMVNLSIFSISVRHRLGLLWYWMIFLGNKPRSFCYFWDCTKCYISDTFFYCKDYSIYSKGFLPTVVDVMVIWIKFFHFSSLIPEMSVFTLAISCLTCLTMSSLPWFMALTFQVPIQCCSYSIRVYFDHQTHLLLSIISLWPSHFILSAPLVIALCSSSVAYWTPSDMGGLSAGVISFCLFTLCMVFL